MTDELPNFKAVTLDEAIEYNDYEHPGSLGKWVAEENARREQAQFDYEAASFEVAGVTVSPGDCVNLTISPMFGGRNGRSLNCVIVHQVVSRSAYSNSRPEHAFRFWRYGAKKGGHVKRDTAITRYVTAVEQVETPQWVAEEEITRKERGW